MGAFRTLFAAGTKKRGNSEWVPWAGGTFSYSAYGHDWLKACYGFFTGEPGSRDRDFWIGRPFGSNIHGFKTAPALRPFGKMMTALLRMANRPDGLGIRPNSLEVTASSAPTTEVIK